MPTDEIRYQILKAIEENPSMSQRELAAHLGVSLGKANYCLKKLVEENLIQVGNLRSSPNKREYAYLLTPSGAKEKAMVTTRFLREKMDEYKDLKKEIERLHREIEQAVTLPDTQDI
jgi:EPS-associated MarR family transcriptional regulator